MSHLVIPQPELDRLLARISELEVAVTRYEGLRQALLDGSFYFHGVNGPDGDGNWEPADFCVLCERMNGRHAETCLVGLYEETQRPQPPTVPYHRLPKPMAGYGITDTPPCPECGAPMKQIRRGASLRKRGVAFVCQVAVEEYRLRTAPADRKHKWTAVWSPAELAAASMPAPAPMPDDDDLPF